MTLNVKNLIKRTQEDSKQKMTEENAQIRYVSYFFEAISVCKSLSN